MPSAFRYAPLAPVRTIRLCLAGRLHVDETAAFLAGGEHNHAIHEGVNRVVLAHTYVKTGMVNRATLTLDDIACFGVLTAKIFTPSRLLSDSRPFFELPTPFLCAISS